MRESKCAHTHYLPCAGFFAFHPAILLYHDHDEKEKGGSELRQPTMSREGIAE